MPADTMLDVSYAGSRGLKLFGFYNGNEAALATLPQYAALCIANFGGSWLARLPSGDLLMVAPHFPALLAT